MLSIRVIGVGKIKESYLKEAIAEYSKRLSKFCKLELVEVPDEKLPSSINPTLIKEIKEKEGRFIVSHIKKDSYVMVLDLKGKQFTSEEFSEKIEDIALRSSSSITFIIGGTLGLSEEVLCHADCLICFSKMTFPHPLIRVFLLEQLFRSFKISKNETYHW